MNLHLMLHVVVIIGLFSSAHSSPPNFVDNAADFIDAGFKKLTRRGVEKEDFTKIDVEAQPLSMIETPSSIDTNHITLEIKSGDGEWREINIAPSVRGGVYRWTEYNVDPCVNHNVRIWVHGLDESKSSFNYPLTISAASLDDIIASGYRPKIPAHVQVGEYSEGTVEISWTPSKCVHSYDVTYQKVTGGKIFSKQVQASKESSITLTDVLDTCSEYEVRVVAVIGDEYSDENIVTFSTPPAQNAAQILLPLTELTFNSVIAKWKGFEKLSCISEYVVSICNEVETCSEGQKVVRDDSLQFLEYKSDSNLKECSEYSLHIQPIHKDINMLSKVVQFRTRSNPIENVASLLTQVKAEAGDKQMITVKWNAIQCANHYEVFQKVNTPDGKWDRIGTTVENYFKQKGVPCTEYKYGVKVTIDDQESEIVEFEQAIMSKLDKSAPFVPSNLDITSNPTEVELSWDHGKCIDSYRIRACRLDGHDQICEETEGIISDSHKARHIMYGLEPCTDYELHIHPKTAGSELMSEVKFFKTSSTAPLSPQFEVKLNERTNKLDFSWSSVQCASSYKISEKNENAEMEIIWHSDSNDEFSVSLDSPEPCEHYSYAMSATFGSEESETKAWTDITIPPRVGISEHPAIVIEEKTNGSVTFVIKINDKNHMCEIEQYHVKYSLQEDFFDPSNLIDGKIVITMQTENENIEGRIRYKGFEDWTPWISSDSPMKEKQTGDEIGLLMPIIIGSVIALALVSLIVFLVVRKKKSQMKYDTEKASGYDDEKAIGNTDESKKLKDQIEDKIANGKIKVID